jgi:hypothetical protein
MAHLDEAWACVHVPQTALERWTVRALVYISDFYRISVMVVPHTVSMQYGRRGRRLSSLLLGSQGAGHYCRGHAQVRGQPNWLARIHKHVHRLNYINHNYCHGCLWLRYRRFSITPSFYLLAIETFKNWWVIVYTPKIILAQIAALKFAYNVYNNETRLTA